ncbi:MAG TPA: barstar family protein [Thermoanaerobaculia bacterium]|jgi:RNAse (barnase) inhibitor barstar
MLSRALPIHFATEELALALRSDPALDVREIDGTLPKEELLNELVEALQLPEYFGHNWDALEECLRDLESDRHVVLLVRDAAPLWNVAPRVMGELVDVWLSATADRGTPLDLVFVW